MKGADEGGVQVKSFSQWIEWAEPLAYGPLNLLPREFEKLQPTEFNQLLEGYNWRAKRKEEFAAYFVSCLMNIEGKSLKHNIGAKHLLEPLRVGNKKAIKIDRKVDKQYLIETFNLKLGGETGGNNS